MWENDSREGHGIQFYGHGGAYYEGGWLMGLQSGWGRRLYDNGAFYEGGWWAGKREGPGLFRTKEGDFFQVSPPCIRLGAVSKLRHLTGCLAG